MFDVGHGDSILICDEDKHSLLVDVGSQTPTPAMCFYLSSFIKNTISPNRGGLVISHYHWDHYSLFHCFRNPRSLFAKIYLPDIETTGEVDSPGYAMMEFLRTAIHFNFGHYRILPEIITNTRVPLEFCRKGTKIKEITPHQRVIWPDFSNQALRSRKIAKIAAGVREALKPIMKEFGIEFQIDPGKKYAMREFVRDLEREEGRYQREPESEKRDVYKTLERIEKDLGPIANTFSIAFRTKYWKSPTLLFLGDVPEAVLNKIHIPTSHTYDFVKASHHGTEFGRSLTNVYTNFLLISRIEKSKKLKRINDGYINELQYNMLLSTSFLGDCFFYNI